MAFTGVYVFSFFIITIYSRDSFNVYPQSMFFEKKILKLSKFCNKNFNIRAEKNICILHGLVFVMKDWTPTRQNDVKLLLRCGD